MVGFGRRNAEDYNFIYEDREYTMLLPPDWSDLNGPTPHAINDNKVIIGRGWDVDSTGALVHKGFIYENGEYTELLPPGWEDSEAWDINNNGTVIGGVAPDPYGVGWPPPKAKGFIYEDGKYTNFLPPGWQQAYPTAINDNGLVVGVAFKTLRASGFIATPITTRDKY